MKILRQKRWQSLLLCGLLAVAGAAGMATLLNDVEAAGPCVCPQVYAPVVCDNGKTYPNLCVANCRHATGCVPVPILPPPI